MATKASVKVRERTLKDGRIRLSYDIYSQGKRELRTDEDTIYILPTDSDKLKKDKRGRAAVKAQELKLAVMKNEYTFRKVTYDGGPEVGRVDLDRFPTFLSLFEAEAKRRSAELAKKHEYKVQQGRQVTKKSHDDVYFCLQRFKSFLKTKGKTDLAYGDFTPRLTEQFKEYLLEAVHDSATKFCRNTAAAYLKKLKTVALFAHREGLLTAKAAHAVPSVSLEKFERTFLNSDEIAVLLEDLRAKPSDTLFKKAFLFCCMVSLRFGDLATMKWSNVKDNKLVFRPGKNQEEKELRIKLNSTALGLIGERKADNQLLFPVKYSSALNDKLNLWIMGNGIRRGRITWHSGRHSCASMVLKKTGNIVAVQHLLGHSKVTTTQRYLHMESKELDDAMDSIDIELPDTEF